MKNSLILLIALLSMSIVNGQNSKSQRLVLLEEFTNASCGPCAAANPGLNTILNANSTKVVSLKYQVNWPGADPMNAQNATDVNTRKVYYAVNSVPKVFLDGNTIAGGENASSFTVSQLNTEYAVASPFTINLSHTMSADYDSIFITCNIISTTAATYTGPLKLHVAITEEEINFCSAPGTNGETDFYNVMRKMLPNASGTTLATTWTLNQTDNHTFSVALPSYIYNKNNIAVVAFIEDDSNKNVKQAAYSAPLSQIQLDAGFECNSLSLPSFTCSTALNPVVTLKNFGTDTITSATINYKPDASSTYTGYSWSGSILPGDTAHINLPTCNVTSGSHTFYVSATLPNNQSDYNTFNNLYTQLYIIGASTGGTTPHIAEGFTLATFPPSGWMNIDITNDGTKWIRSSTVGGFGNSTNSAKIAFFNIASGNSDELFIKPVDLSTLTSASLTFNVAYAQYSSSYKDTIKVMVSTNCGTTWFTPYSKNGSALATAPIATSSFVPTSSQWRTESIDLTPYVGNQAVYIKFHAGSNYGNNAYIDDININTYSLSTESIFVNNIEITPNPSSGLVNITNLDNANIIIYNLLGNKIMEFNNESGNKQLDLSKFDNGIYMFQIISNNKTTTKKVIINK